MLHQNVNIIMFLIIMVLVKLCSSVSSPCKFTKNIDIGFRNGSSVIDYKLGNFTEDQCCEMCMSNVRCAAAALLDKTHGSHEGCWLQSETQLIPHAAKGITLCDSKRKNIPAVEHVKLTLLDKDDHPNAKCMDGSQAGFYLASNLSSNSWIIELQGGGECATKKNCDARKGSPLFSSNFFPKTVVHRFLNAQQNTMLNTFNRVLIPYCSQDLWTGQRKNNSEETFGYYFSGHLIIDAVLTELENNANLKDAIEIIVTGESAGGIGVWPNVDWISERYVNARVVAAPIAGFYFFAYPYNGPGHTGNRLTDFSKSAWPSHYTLWQSFVDETCANALNEPGYCILANYSFPFVKSNAFIIEAQTDQVVLLYHDWIPNNQDPDWSNDVKRYFSEWHDNMTIALEPSMSKDSKNGVFNPACFIHTGFNLQSPLIEGLNFVQAFSKWFFNEVDKVKLQDTCGILCNPTCKH